MNTSTIEHSGYFCRSRWRINSRLNLLVNWIQKHNRVVVEGHEKRSRFVEVLVSVTLVALPHTTNILFGDVVAGCQVTNEADFNETFKYHGVDLVADKFHILNGIGLNRILNG